MAFMFSTAAPCRAREFAMQYNRVAAIWAGMT
jgi:hypothetical protein